MRSQDSEIHFSWNRILVVSCYNPMSRITLLNGGGGGCKLSDRVNKIGSMGNGFASRLLSSRRLSCSSVTL